MLGLCSNDNKELLVSGVILHQDSVVLPWIDGCAEAAVINDRKMLARSNHRFSNNNSKTSLLASPTSSAAPTPPPMPVVPPQTQQTTSVAVSIAAPNSLLTGAARFIRSLFNMCAPWYSVTGKTSHVSGLFTSPPTNPFQQQQADSDHVPAQNADADGKSDDGKVSESGAGGGNESSLNTAVVMSEDSPSISISTAKDPDVSIGGLDVTSPIQGTNPAEGHSPLSPAVAGGGSSSSSCVTPLRRQDCDTDFECCGDPQVPSQPMAGSETIMGPRPLSQPIQFSKEWISVVTFRLLLSWKGSSSSGASASTTHSKTNLMAVGENNAQTMASSSGQSTPRSTSSTAAIGASLPTPSPHTIAGPLPACFSSNSKTILDHFLKHYNLSGGTRKNGLFHSTLRSLLVLLESDINPSDLPNMGTGSFQCDTTDYHKNYFIGNFAALVGKNGAGGVNSGNEDEAKKAGSASDEEDTVTLDEAVMKLKFLILGRLNLLAPARQSLLTAHRALLPYEFVTTWDEVALKNAQEAAAAALAAQANAKSSSAAVADICRSLRESYQQDGHAPSSSSPNSNSIDGIGKLVAQQQQQLLSVKPANSEGDGGAVARRPSGSSSSAGASNTTPYRAPSPDAVVVGVNGNSPKTSPSRRSPMVSYGTPPRGTPPRMVDELSLNHPPTTDGSSSASGSANAASAFPRRLRDMMTRISPTRPPSHGGSQLPQQQTTQMRLSPGGTKSNSPLTNSAPASSATGSAVSTGGTATASVPTSYRSSPNAKQQSNVPVVARTNSLAAMNVGGSAITDNQQTTALPAKASDTQSVKANGNNTNFEATVPSLVSPSSPNYNADTNPNSPAAGHGQVVSPTTTTPTTISTHPVPQSNTSGRVSPKLPPSKQAVDPPMRRKHLRATDSNGRDGEDKATAQHQHQQPADADRQNSVPSLVEDEEPEPTPTKPTATALQVAGKEAATPSPSPSVSPASVMTGRILPVVPESPGKNLAHVPQQPSALPPNPSGPSPRRPSLDSRPPSSSSVSQSDSGNNNPQPEISGSAKFRHHRPPSSGSTSPRSAPVSATTSRSSAPTTAEKDKRGYSEPVSSSSRAPTAVPPSTSNASNKNPIYQSGGKRSNSAGPTSAGPPSGTTPTTSPITSPRTRQVLAAAAGSTSGSVSVGKTINKNAPPTGKK
eukprot:GILI01009068.1.p1 GENE.GILI01009068.1~~GILI01009068.1.p1  ORF type:complete len:1265 (+),score=237.89 GILI01009068.1:287-3796(+)